MTESNYPTCDVLEGRMLFSVTPAQQVAADKVALTAAKNQLTTDRRNYSTLVAADRTQLKTDLSTELNAAVTQLKADVAAEKLAVLTDQQNGAKTLAADRATILADKTAVAADKKNPTAEAAALGKLASDKSILATDTTDLKNTIASDRATGAVQVKADTAGLKSVQTQSDTTLKADKNKISTDLKGAASAFASDAKTIAVDEAKLVKDELIELGSNILGSI